MSEIKIEEAVREALQKAFEAHSLDEKTVSLTDTPNPETAKRFLYVLEKLGYLIVPIP